MDTTSAANTCKVREREMVINTMKGWSAIIQELYVKLEKFDISIIEIKEKWGVLRIIYDFEGNDNDEDRKKIREILQEAEDKSSVICELCGKDAELKNIDGWLKTYCNDCTSKGKRWWDFR